MRHLKILIILFVLALFSVVRAQNLSDYNNPSLPSLIPGLEEQIDVNVSPTNPAPNQPVTITLEAFGTDLNRANISWLINGAVKQNGVGQTQFSFVTGKAGSASDVTIYIVPVNGQRITKELRISPASVDIVWEAPGSYVPPFYKGKKLYPPEGNLTFVALPNLVLNGASIDPKSLVYKWSINNSVVADRSGYGKNVLTVTGDILNQPFSIDVEASSVKNGVVGSGSIYVSSYQPLMMLYENSPLYGILFNQQLANEFNLKNQEVNISAYPYYFTLSYPTDSSINYSWAINGGQIFLPQHQNTVAFRQPEGVSEGQTSVAVNGVNQIHFLQSASGNVLVNYSNRPNVSF